jgi:hypothetical protein
MMRTARLRTLIIMELPLSLPTPRFRLWQRVRCYPGDEILEVSGRIVGLWFDGEWAYHVQADPAQRSGRIEPCSTVHESFIHLQG